MTEYPGRSPIVTLEYTVNEQLSKNNLLLVTAEVIDFLDGDAPEIVLTRAMLNDEGVDIDLFTHAKHCEWKQQAFEWWCTADQKIEDNAKGTSQ